MENKNRTTKEQLEEWDRVLDEYEKSVGLGSYKSDLFPEDEINLYFSMNRDHIEKLNPEDCLQIAYRLGQFALHVQRSTNREIARLNWADETIKEVIADEINNYKGYGFLEKSIQAIKHNDKAESLNKIKKYAKQRSDRLSYLSGNIKNLSDILMMVYRTKNNTRS
jgi:hypothetical protein